MIAIFTHSKDLTADLVIRHLLARGVEYLRIDGDRLGTLECYLGYSTESELVIGPRVVHASEVSAVWARRFTLPETLKAVPTEHVDFVKRETSAVLHAFIESISADRQINPFSADHAAGNRLLQARRARMAGFSVPATLATQDPVIARHFLSAHPTAITKAISFGRISSDPYPERVAYTSRVSLQTDLSGLAICPSLFQENIRKRYEWRVTTVGERVFAARLDPADLFGEIDWRRSQQSATAFIAAELPRLITEKLLTLCASSGLVFGAHDLIETPDGDFVFLETNPAGQWGWLELNAGLPIGDAIASELISRSRGTA